MADTKPAPPLPSPSTSACEVVVHPLVLLSSVDHYARLYGVSSPSQFRKRAVGVLLGTTTAPAANASLQSALTGDVSAPSADAVINITSSYASRSHLYENILSFL